MIFMEIKDVLKKYQKFCLGPINLNLNEGDTIALMGKNGSGKTTLFQIITGSFDATSGKVIYKDKILNPEAFMLKRDIGYLPQNFYLPKWVTGKEIMSYAVKLYNLDNSKINQMIEFWDFDYYKDIPMGACSHGMQKRVALALASIHNPSMVILDEPFSGLDMYHIKALTNFIESRSKENKLTIICTHIAPYAAKLCNRTLIMDNGKCLEITKWSNSDYLEKISILEKEIFD